MWVKSLDESVSFEYERPVITDPKSQTYGFKDSPWIPLDLGKSSSSRFQATSFPLDFGFTSIHCLYKFTFTASEGSNIKLTLSSRHRSTLYLNGVAFDGAMTYSLQLFMPGFA
jgi:hypothetical protein